MSPTFHCPNCGAPLDPPAGSNLSMRCPFCSSSVIVPNELRKPLPENEILSREEAMQKLPDSGRNLIEIFQPDGRWLEKIQLPLQARNLDVGPDGLLYVVTKEPRVYIFELK